MISKIWGYIVGTIAGILAMLLMVEKHKRRKAEDEVLEVTDKHYNYIIEAHEQKAKADQETDEIESVLNSKNINNAIAKEKSKAQTNTDGVKKDEEFTFKI